MDEELKKALYKKAKGYKEREVTEEYAGDGEEMRLLKRKVVYKNIPPDLSAIKLIGEGSKSEFSHMTDEELERERARLLAELAKCQSDGSADGDARRDAKQARGTKRRSKSTASPKNKKEGEDDNGNCQGN